MTNSINSPKFGELNIVRVNPEDIQIGNIVTIYYPSSDSLDVYQYQGNGHVTVHGVVSVNEVHQYSGITGDDFKAIIDSSNKHTSKQYIVKMPSTISTYVLEQIPNVFLKMRYGKPAWLG